MSAVTEAADAVLDRIDTLTTDGPSDTPVWDALVADLGDPQVADLGAGGEQA